MMLSAEPITLTCIKQAPRRDVRFMDGPDEVHLRTVARAELARARERRGASAAYFTTPEQLLAEPRLR